jgi:RHS repeat-associated protein
MYIRNKLLKIISSSAFGIFMITVLQAQPSTSQNYVLINSVKQADATTEPLVNNLPITTQGKGQTVTYIDGLGRPMQNVVTQASAGQMDLITGIEYDGFGREAKKYLPYSDLNNTSSPGGFRPSFNAAQSAFYNGQLTGVDIDAAPYSLSALEASPLNRIQAQGAVGSAWQPNMASPYDATTHSVKYQYLVNSSSDNVLLFNVDSIGNINSPGYYPAGQIYIKMTTDEQGQTVKEYTDKSGHMVLKRVFIASDSLQTYYLYDNLDMLRAVIQPEGVAAITPGVWTPPAGFAGKWMFLYRYDQRNRMVMKKVPGADSVLMIYDQWDRVVLTQDGNLRVPNNFLFTKYDTLNRPVVSGIVSDSRSQSAIRADVAASFKRFETVNVSATEGYTLNNSYPSSTNYTLTVLTTTHYDNYSNLPSWSSGYSFVNEYSVSPQNTFLQGQVIAVQNKIIGTSNYIRNVSYFDDKYRVIQNTLDNNAGGKDRVTKILSFDGKDLQDFHNHTSRFYTTPLLITQNYSYDHVDRLLQVTHQTANQEIVTLAQNSYNELGQPLNKKLHQSPSHPSALQKIDYTYNIRGWIENINKVASFETGYEENDLFCEELAYNTNLLPYYTTAEFNGNIAQIGTKGGYDEYLNGYIYAYDQANRLTSAYYGGGPIISRTLYYTYSNLYNESNIQYDRNGNINLLKRYHGDLGLIDDLHYNNYNGNQLGTILDQSGSTSTVGFQDKTNGSSNDYAYDANGNLISDFNKSITATTYNYLNLPTLVTITAKGTIGYTYDASGNKLQKTITDQTVTPNKITNYYYAGDFVYRNDTLEFVSHAEGRLRPVRIDTLQPISIANLKYIYDYFLKDHIGTVRTVITTEQETDLYAATMETANATKENLLFSNISSTTVAKPGGFDTDNNNQKVSQLNGNVNITGNKRVGPSIVLKVMTGDTISISTYGWYTGATQPAATGVTAIANDILPLFYGGVLFDNGNKGGSILNTDISSFLSSVLNTFINIDQPYDANRPKAFLNWIIVDEQFNTVPSPNHLGAIQMPLITGSMQKQLMVGPASMVVRRNGWLYVYLSNESNQNVFFDNLVINHTRGPVVEKKEFYPFGMEIPGLSTQAFKPKYDQNRYKYNGIEYDSAFGLNDYDAHFRNLDPEIGRWSQIDPKIELGMEGISGYASMYDNPVRYNDPQGDCPLCLIPILIGLLLASEPAAGPSTDHSKAVQENRAITDAHNNSAIEVGTSFLSGGAKAGYQGIKMFHDMFSSENKSPDLTNEIKQTQNEIKRLEKSERSFEGLIKEHKDKLEQFKKDPIANTKKELLEGKSPEVQEKIIQGRIKAIEKQIQKQEGELNKVKQNLQNAKDNFNKETQH